MSDNQFSLLIITLSVLGAGAAIVFVASLVALIAIIVATLTGGF